MTFPTGCYYFPQETAAYVLRRQADGIPCDVGQLGVDGAWQRLVERGVYGVFAGEVERELRGEESPVRSQNRGTCDSQGTAQGCQDTITYKIQVHGAVGLKDIDISAETIYALGRSVGGNRYYTPAGNNPRNDGMAGVHSSIAVHKWGVLKRGVYGGIDMSVPRESWGVEWADRWSIPQELMRHLVPMDACQKIETGQELADMSASGFFGKICSTWQFDDLRDENGECQYQGPTAHSESYAGVYVRKSWDGNPATLLSHTGIVRRQSWNGVPNGPDILRHYKGTYKLRRGEYGIRLQDAVAALRTMEAWGYAAPVLPELWRDAA